MLKIDVVLASAMDDKVDLEMLTLLLEGFHDDILLCVLVSCTLYEDTYYFDYRLFLYSKY